MMKTEKVLQVLPKKQAKFSLNCTNVICKYICKNISRSTKKDELHKILSLNSLEQYIFKWNLLFRYSKFKKGRRDSSGDFLSKND